MNTKNLVFLSLLIGIGTVLHVVTPPILFGMKPDMLLSMMFLGIVLIPRLNYVLILSILTGLMSALTTSAPGGQIANMIDKPITAILFFVLLLLCNKLFSQNISIPLLTATGTMISGSIFLTVALFVLGFMEGGFVPLFLTIVLPAAAINMGVMLVIYPIIQRIMKRTQLITLS